MTREDIEKIRAAYTTAFWRGRQDIIGDSLSYETEVNLNPKLDQICQALSEGRSYVLDEIRLFVEENNAMTDETDDILKRAAAGPPFGPVHWPDKPSKPTDETHWLKWFHHQVRMPGGDGHEWGYVHCRDAIAVVARDTQGNIALVRQYRYAFGAYIEEIPKGFVEDEEDALSAAQRELSEEIGREAANWLDLGQMVAAPGIGKVVHYVYLAQDLSVSGPHTARKRHGEEAPEQLEVLWVSLTDFAQKVAQGEITDAVTIASVHKAAQATGG